MAQIPRAQKIDRPGQAGLRQTGQHPPREFSPRSSILMKWLRAGLSVPFAVLGFFIGVFMSNRGWLERQLSRKTATRVVQGFIVATMLAWFAIWIFATDEHREDLNRAVKSFWTEIGQ